jgi:hypothetical protein
MSAHLGNHPQAISTNQIDSPSDDWMNALMDLHNRYYMLRPRAFQRRLNALRSLLLKVGCDVYVRWLIGYPAPVHQHREAEIAALKAVQESVALDYYNSADEGDFGADQQQEVRNLVRRVIVTVKARLQELDGDAAPTHSADFTSVNWFGTKYQFVRGQQAESVRVLWNAWENKTPSLSEKTIGEEICSVNDRFRLEHVFNPTKKKTSKRQPHPAWGKMIIRVGQGVYALSPP